MNNISHAYFYYLHKSHNIFLLLHIFDIKNVQKEHNIFNCFNKVLCIKMSIDNFLN